MAEGNKNPIEETAAAIAVANEGNKGLFSGGEDEATSATKKPEAKDPLKKNEAIKPSELLTVVKKAEKNPGDGDPKSQEGQENKELREAMDALTEARMLYAKKDAYKDQMKRRMRHQLQVGGVFKSLDKEREELKENYVAAREAYFSTYTDQVMTKGDAEKQGLIRALKNGEFSDFQSNYADAQREQSLMPQAVSGMYEKIVQGYSNLSTVKKIGVGLTLGAITIGAGALGGAAIGTGASVIKIGWMLGLSFSAGKLQSDAGFKDKREKGYAEEVEGNMKEELDSLVNDRKEFLTKVSAGFDRELANRQEATDLDKVHSRNHALVKTAISAAIGFGLSQAFGSVLTDKIPSWLGGTKIEGSSESAAGDPAAAGQLVLTEEKIPNDENPRVWYSGVDELKLFQNSDTAHIEPTETSEEKIQNDENPVDNDSAVISGGNPDVDAAENDPGIIHNTGNARVAESFHQPHSNSEIPSSLDTGVGNVGNDGIVISGGNPDVDAAENDPGIIHNTGNARVEESFHQPHSNSEISSSLDTGVGNVGNDGIVISGGNPDVYAAENDPGLTEKTITIDEKGEGFIAAVREYLTEEKGMSRGDADKEAFKLVHEYAQSQGKSVDDFNKVFLNDQIKITTDNATNDMHVEFVSAENTPAPSDFSASTEVGGAKVNETSANGAEAATETVVAAQEEIVDLKDWNREIGNYDQEYLKNLVGRDIQDIFHSQTLGERFAQVAIDIRETAVDRITDRPGGDDFAQWQSVNMEHYVDNAVKELGIEGRPTAGESVQMYVTRVSIQAEMIGKDISLNPVDVPIENVNVTSVEQAANSRVVDNSNTAGNESAAQESAAQEAVTRAQQTGSAAGVEAETQPNTLNESAAQMSAERANTLVQNGELFDAPAAELILDRAEYNAGFSQTAAVEEAEKLMRSREASLRAGPNRLDFYAEMMKEATERMANGGAENQEVFRNIHQYADDRFTEISNRTEEIQAQSGNGSAQY